MVVPSSWEVSGAGGHAAVDGELGAGRAGRSVHERHHDAGREFLRPAATPAGRPTGPRRVVHSERWSRGGPGSTGRPGTVAGRAVRIERLHGTNSNTVQALDSCISSVRVSAAGPVRELLEKTEICIDKVARPTGFVAGTFGF